MIYTYVRGCVAEFEIYAAASRVQVCVVIIFGFTYAYEFASKTTARERIYLDKKIIWHF